MDVSVVIVTYNTLKMTYECIKSIQEHTHGIEYEILLVDNASMDGSKEFFDKIVSAIGKKLRALGYSATNDLTRFSLKISWNSNSKNSQNYR